MTHITDEAAFDFLHGIASADDARMCREHLEKCAECRERVVAVGEFERALMTQPLEQVSVDFTARVMESIEPAVRREPAGIPTWYWLAFSLILGMTYFLAPTSAGQSTIAEWLHPLTDSLTSGESQTVFEIGIAFYMLWAVDRLVAKWLRTPI